MVGPERKREAVVHVQHELAVSERRACTTIRQPRSTQRYRGRRRSKDAALAAELRRISAAHPRAGYRDEFLNREAFASVLEAKVLGRQHRHWHNQGRPHSSLEDQTPVEFAQRSHAAASATLRQPHGCALPQEHQTNNQTPEPNQKLS